MVNKVYDLMIDQANIPKLYLIDKDIYPDSCDEKIYKQLKDYEFDITDIVRDDMPTNLILCSKITGNGKTTWATRLMKRYLEDISTWNEIRFEDKDIVHAAFVDVNRMLFKAKDFKDDRAFRKRMSEVEKADFVIFDDIGATVYTEYEYQILYNLINYRVSNCLFNLYTMNCTSYESLSKSVGNRLANRIWRNSDILEFKGKGMR